ncbi:MAG TPA: zf-TFIIB domain-containing protein [Myxococcaceae bacterium]
MSSCPFCYGTLRPTLSNGLPREQCGRCSSLWFEGEALAKVVGRPATDALIERARGQHGKCKGCKAPLDAVPECTRCRHAAPTCPQCGSAPLSVAVVHGVEVDICPGCRGVALDAGELEVLSQADEASRAEGLELAPLREAQRLIKPKCTTCQRKLQLEHAFTLEDQLYCGSCAPEGCAPYEVELTRAIPTLEAHYSPTGMHITRTRGADPISRFIEGLFSRNKERILVL